MSRLYIEGDEHLIFEHLRSIYNRRKTHRQAVLMEYAEQMKEGSSDMHALAELSRILSKRTASQARERAARVARVSSIYTNRPALQAWQRAARAA